MGKITATALRETRAFGERKFWDDRAKRWIAEEDDRRHAEALELIEAPAAAGRRRRTKWAVDHLYEQEVLTPAQHDAAHRLVAVIARAEHPPRLAGSSLVAVHPAWDQTFATEVDRAARAWDGAQSREIARTARLWVLAAPRTTKSRMRLYGLLFAFPQRSWKSLSSSRRSLRDPGGTAARVAALLDVVAAFWEAQDCSYGASATEPSAR